MAIPVALSTAEIARRVRIPESLAALPEVGDQLRGFQTLARALVAKSAPEAPGDVQTEAIVAVVSYLYDRPSASSGSRFANVWKNSGAAAMLRAWTVRRALGVLEPGGAPRAPGPAPGDGTGAKGTPPPAPGDGTDPEARAAAAAAQTAAEAASAAATRAQATADGASAAAETAQGTATAASEAAAAAQTAADGAQTAADGAQATADSASTGATDAHREAEAASAAATAAQTAATAAQTEATAARTAAASVEVLAQAANARADAAHTAAEAAQTAADTANALPETLYDDLAAGTLVLRSNSGSWATAERILFPRALTAADDGGTVAIAGEYTHRGATKYWALTIPAALFRRMPANDGRTATAAGTLTHYLQRPVSALSPSLLGWAEAALHIARWRSIGGSDGIWFNCGSSPNLGNVDPFRVRVELRR